MPVQKESGTFDALGVAQAGRLVLAEEEDDRQRLMREVIRRGEVHGTPGAGEGTVERVGTGVEAVGVFVGIDSASRPGSVPRCLNGSTATQKPSSARAAPESAVASGRDTGATAVSIDDDSRGRTRSASRTSRADGKRSAALFSRPSGASWPSG